MDSPRPFSAREVETIRRLWATAVTDKELEERINRHRGVIYRKAHDIGLPGRRVARTKVRAAI